MLLNILIKTKAKTDSLTVKKGTIFVSIKEEAKEGKANKYLQTYLAEIFNISRGQIQIVSGIRARSKKIEIRMDEISALKVLDKYR